MLLSFFCWELKMKKKHTQMDVSFIASLNVSLTHYLSEGSILLSLRLVSDGHGNSANIKLLLMVWTNVDKHACMHVQTEKYYTTA